MMFVFIYGGREWRGGAPCNISQVFGDKESGKWDKTSLTHHVEQCRILRSSNQ